MSSEQNPPNKASQLLRVLLVEDSEDDALLILRYLRRGGYRVEFERVETEAAMSQALARPHALSNRSYWDIVLADYFLPEFSGPAALDLLQRCGLDVPFIIVSGEIGEQAAVAMMKAGAHDYINKGNLIRLVPIVERECKEAAGRRERQRLEAQNRLLQSLAIAISETPDFHSALQVAIAQVCEVTSWDYAEAWIPNAEGTALVPSSAWYWQSPGLEKFRQASHVLTLAPHVGIVGRVWATMQPEWHPDVSTQPPEVFTRVAVAKACGLKAGLGVPIVADRQVLAVVLFLMFETREEDRQLVQLIGSVAMQLGTLMQRKLAEEALRDREHWLDTLVNAVPEFVNLKDAQGRWLVANDYTVKLLGLEQISYQGLTNAQLAELSEFYRETLLESDKTDEIAWRSPTLYKWEVTVLDPQGSPRLFDFTKVPLFNLDGSRKGLLTIGRDITERKQAEAKLSHYAFYDPLTSLPNRTLFLERLQQLIPLEAANAIAEPSVQCFALLFLEVSNFKVIKYSLGHVVADCLLSAMAQRLQSCLSAGDLLARIGSDDFAILLQGIVSANEATQLADRLQAHLQEPFAVEGRAVFATASIGIVLGNGAISASSGCREPNAISTRRSEDYLRAADTAMHHAKRLGKSYAIFDPAMHAGALARLQLETDLRRSLDALLSRRAVPEFILHYQPIVRLATGQIVGFEALVRWMHPERGFLSPDRFIPLAEETGLIIPLSTWVLQEACRQMQEWQQHFKDRWQNLDEPITMSVNLSGIQLSQPNLLLQIDQILAATQLEGRYLKLEITESAIVGTATSTISLLNQLKQRQIQLCIDDFGTGYSSLSQLHKLPIDTLKIDRSFVSGIEVDNSSGKLLGTIVTLAESLGLDVVAEGVETLEQVAMLKALPSECKYGQGYLFSKPVNAEIAKSLLSIDQS